VKPEKGAEMLKFIRPEKKTSVIDPVIETLISEMAGYDASDEAYTTASLNLKTLIEAKAVEPKPDRVSLDTIVVVAANLVGIAMILAFEKNGIITSKSMSLLNRPRT
jgi:hypothetical protein